MYNHKKMNLKKKFYKSFKQNIKIIWNKKIKKNIYNKYKKNKVRKYNLIILIC